MGSVTVNASESGQTVSQVNGVQNYTETTPTVITQSTATTTNTVTITATENATANVTIQDVNIANSDPSGSPQNHSGQAAVTIDVADGAEANVTLDGVNIDVSGTGNIRKNAPGEAAVQITGNGDVTLELDGTNTVQSGSGRAGVEKNTITATSTNPGNGNGNLTITDENGTAGSLESTGGLDGSGIGGGHDRSGSNITITGTAEVTAQGGLSASGIGGGSWCDGSYITITGSAEVTAQGGNSASGIGGGGRGSGSNITIEGNANVTANGGGAGAGIGGGVSGSGSQITIQGSAEVTAKGGDKGAGIGGGYYGGTGSNITVSEDAQVKAQGGKAGQVGDNYFGAGAAIGDGGKYSNSSPDNIAGDEVTPNTDALDEGWIATYAPGTTDLDTATPDSLTYKDTSGTVQTATENIQIEDAQSATCIEDGHQAGFSVDGALVAVTIPHTGHNVPNGYTPQNDATCTTLGTRKGYCTNCKTDISITDPNSTLKDHTFTTYTPDPGNLATCTEAGTKTAKCEHCTATNTIPDPVKGHSMGEYYTTLEATCQQEGLERADCKNCSYYETNTLKKVDHSYGEYTSDDNATYTADGTKTAKCIWCDATDTVTDPGSRLVWVEDAPLYRVIDQNRKALSCKAERKDGVLTITVEADFAALTGKLGGIQTLKAQGIDTIVFVTNGATSTFALSDLLSQGSTGDSYTLTHDGSTVTFTLGAGKTDISAIPTR